MFENLSERLGGVFDRLTKQGALSEDDVKTAVRDNKDAAATINAWLKADHARQAEN